MADVIAGFLEVGRDDNEVIVNHPDLKPDENGVGHIVFSAAQARNLAALLVKFAAEIEQPEPTYSITATGDGAQTILALESELHEELHKVFCACGRPWAQCEEDDGRVKKTIQTLDE